MTVYQDHCAIRLTVNGEEHMAVVRPADLLIDVLRHQLGLTGAKPGCLNGDCGTCTVLMDGFPVKSCLVLAVEAEGHDLLTVEGLHGDAPAQRAFVEARAFQCGYCTSGFLLVCHSLSLQSPWADEYEAERWLASNLCRCTGYEEIGNAVKKVLEEARQMRNDGERA